MEAGGSAGNAHGDIQSLFIWKYKTLSGDYSGWKRQNISWYSVVNIDELTADMSIFHGIFPYFTRLSGTLPKKITKINKKI